MCHESSTLSARTLAGDRVTCESLGADIPLGRSGARCSVTDARHDRAGFPANSCVPVVAGNRGALTPQIGVRTLVGTHHVGSGVTGGTLALRPVEV